MEGTHRLIAELESSCNFYWTTDVGAEDNPSPFAFRPPLACMGDCGIVHGPATAGALHGEDIKEAREEAERDLRQLWKVGSHASW